MNKHNKIIILATTLIILIIAVLSSYHAINSKPLATTYKNQTAIKPSSEHVFHPTKHEINDTEIINKYPAISEILTTKNVNTLLAILEKFLSQLNENEIHEVASYFSQSNLPSDRYEIVNITTIKYWSKLSIFNALSFSQSQFSDPTRFNATSEALITHCTALKLIKECIHALPNEYELDKNIQSITQKALNDNHYPTALFWANAIVTFDRRTQLIDIISDQWVVFNAEEAFIWGNSHENFTATAIKAIKKILTNDPWLAYNLVTQISDTHSEKRSQLYTVLVNSLVDTGDFLTIMSILESASQHEAVTGLARKWIEADPKNALEWALNYEEFYSLGLRAIDELTKTNHQQAFEITILLPDSRKALREDMFNSIFSDRAKNNDFETIMQLIQQLPQQEKAEDYYDNFITQWAWEDPLAAMNAVLELPNSPKKAALITNTTKFWAKQSPKDALLAINKLTDRTLKENATTGILEGWTSTEPSAVAQWLSSQPSSPALDASISQASSQLLRGQRDKSIILTIAEKISDNTLRESTLKKINNHVFSELEFDLDE